MPGEAEAPKGGGASQAPRDLDGAEREPRGGVEAVLHRRPHRRVVVAAGGRHASDRREEGFQEAADAVQPVLPQPVLHGVLQGLAQRVQVHCLGPVVRHVPRAGVPLAAVVDQLPRPPRADLPLEHGHPVAPAVCALAAGLRLVLGAGVQDGARVEGAAASQHHEAAAAPALAGLHVGGPLHPQPLHGMFHLVLQAIALLHGQPSEAPQSLGRVISGRSAPGLGFVARRIAEQVQHAVAPAHLHAHGRVEAEETEFRARLVVAASLHHLVNDRAHDAGASSCPVEAQILVAAPSGNTALCLGLALAHLQAAAEHGRKRVRLAVGPVELSAVAHLLTGRRAEGQRAVRQRAHLPLSANSRQVVEDLALDQYASEGVAADDVGVQGRVADALLLGRQRLRGAVVAVRRAALQDPALRPASDGLVKVAARGMA
mmetsp:Transcript_32483/g.92674  ORF Transcript_32483/g.92674 Transcript_32483/m.92674 type:complete len:430 (-) Transcript_32483:838-2127(-)